MSTLTLEQQQSIANFLNGRRIPAGLGTEEAACSIASINLALTGHLSDYIPDCMSAVIGRWIIRVQDAMPDEMRNSDEWRRLLPLAAGTGRDHELARRDIVLDWMWGTVLPHLQTLADSRGFGDPWRAMCELRTAEAAREARYAAYAATAYADAADAAAYATAAATAYADAADAAAYAAATAYADAADAAAYATAAATAYAAYADAADAAAYATADATAYATTAYATADATAYAATAAATAYAADAAYAATAYAATAWQHFDPCGLLARLITVSNETPA